MYLIFMYHFLKSFFRYSLKPHASSKEHDSTKNGGVPKLGEIYLQLFYTADHILPLKIYQSLYKNLISSLSLQPFCSSLVGILEYLPSVCIHHPVIVQFSISGHQFFFYLSKNSF